MNGEELRRRRLAAGLSLDQVAELLDLKTASRRTAVYKLERNGSIRPAMAKLLDLVLTEVEGNPKAAPPKARRGRPPEVTV